jgi:hypothetical protein
LRAWQQIGISDWIGFVSIAKFKALAGGLGFFWRQISDTIAFHPVDDMATKMLTVDLLIELKILALGRRP